MTSADALLRNLYTLQFQYLPRKCIVAGRRSRNFYNETRVHE